MAIMVSTGEPQRSVEEKAAVTAMRPAAAAARNLYDELYPMRWLMFLFTLWPLGRDRKGRVVSTLWSAKSLYFFPMYAIMSLINVEVTNQRLELFLQHTDDFNDLVFYMLFLLLLIGHWFTPFVHWEEASRLAQLFNTWTDFQEKWERQLGEPLHLEMRKRAIIAFGLGVVFPVSLVSSEIYLADDLSIFQGVAYIPIATFFFMTSQTWFIATGLLISVSKRLQHHFERDVISGRLSPKMVRVHCRLWNDLQSITIQTGKAQSSTLLFYINYSMIITVASGFGMLIAGTHGVLAAKAVGQFFLALDNIAHVFIAHDAGYKASTAVALDMRISLLHLKNNYNEQIASEVRNFLYEIDSNSPKINLGGFTCCSRESVVTVYKWIVSNLLVMLQFAYFLPSGKEVLVEKQQETAPTM